MLVIVGMMLLVWCRCQWFCQRVKAHQHSASSQHISIVIEWSSRMSCSLVHLSHLFSYSSDAAMACQQRWKQHVKNTLSSHESRYFCGDASDCGREVEEDNAAHNLVHLDRCGARSHPRSFRGGACTPRSLASFGHLDWKTLSLWTRQQQGISGSVGEQWFKIEILPKLAQAERVPELCGFWRYFTHGFIVSSNLVEYSVVVSGLGAQASQINEVPRLAKPCLKQV